ncbi:MAG: hypothetical protein IJT69_04250 [Clostridia bacterium]|nr:hypothetical protein [Clostridia bacterium]
MKKLLIIIPVVIVIAAATVLGLFAAGVIGKKDEPVAYAVDSEATEVGVFKELGVDTFFDVRADRDPSTALDNFVIVHDNKGNKVPLKSTRQGDGVYRITARDGFKPRATYRIWATGSTFVAEQYKDLDTFIFTIKGGAETETVTVKEGIKKLALAGTTVTPLEQNGETYYTITLAAAAEARFGAGEVILAKKPVGAGFDEDLEVLYAGEIENYEYNGFAAYVVERESRIVDGKEEIYCRLASLGDVVKNIDIYKTLTIDENNFTVNEAMLQEALDKSEFTAAVYEAAVEAFDLFSGQFEKTVRNENPKITAKFAYEVDKEKIQLDFYFIVTLAKGMDLTFAVKNTINLTPNLNWQFDGTDLDDLQLDLGVNIKTKTVASVEMETSDAKLQATDIEDFKKKFTDLVTGKTAEKGIVGAELPIYSYKYPIYCFVLGIEFGVDINLGIKAQVDFEYVYETDITAGVTYVDGKVDTYKSIDTSSSAKDLVLLGKVKAEAGVYVKLTASLLEVVGIGFKVKTGVYAEIAGQLRLDMQAALNKELHIIKGYYVTGGLYLAFDFELKAGLDIPYIGYKGWDKSWELGRLEYPLFEYGSKYLVQSLVNDDMTVEVQGKTAAFNEIEVNAFDLDKVADANHVKVPLDSFDIEYLDGAENYITLENGLVKVNPAVGTEFTAVVKITAKNDNYVTGTVSFHKAAVMPTCADTSRSFDKNEPADVTFDVKKNQSSFIGLNGVGITVASYAAQDTGAVTIYKEFLADLAVGEHEFIYVTDKGRVTLTVVVFDSTPIGAPVTAATFSKTAKANVVFALELSGSKVEKIEGLNAGDYSVDSAGTLVIYASALENKAAGDYDLTVVATNDSTLDLIVTVEDDRVPALYESKFTFSKNAGVKHNVAVAFEAYTYSVVGVEGKTTRISESDYEIAQGKVNVLASYLSGLNQGDYSFTLKFTGATGVESRNFKITVSDTAAIVAGVSYATFDKAAPADVEYTIYTTGSSIILADNGIKSTDYTVSGSAVKVKASYLAKLAVGSYTFRVSAGSSATEVSLTVVDNTKPVIESAKGGVLTIEYDKAQGGDRFFEMMLGSATFQKVDGNGVAGQYTIGVNDAKGTTKITIRESYLNSLRVGTYTYNVLTDVNVTTLIVKVSDTRKPESTTETSLNYVRGALLPVVVSFKNYEHGVKSIAVKGGTDFSLFDGDGDFDPQSGTLTISSSWLNAQEANSYVTLMLTFDDAASTVLAVTVAIN